MKLEGKCALITGAGKNLGKAMALEMAREGASVIINELRDVELAMQVVREVNQTGGRGMAALADITRPEQVAEMVQAVLQEFGRIDVLVNNVGFRSYLPIMQTPDEVWHKTLATNLTGPYNCIKAVLPGMMERKWGRIINIIGTIGHKGEVNAAAISASKSGMVGLTRSLGVEMAPHGITVNGVSPGTMNTVRGPGFRREVLDEQLKEIPAGRFAETKEIARVGVFLASDDAAYITGETLCVNGGTFQL